MKTDFATAKLARPFVVWLKLEAARRGVPIYELVEELVARGGPRPWRAEKRFPEVKRKHREPSVLSLREMPVIDLDRSKFMKNRFVDRGRSKSSRSR